MGEATTLYAGRGNFNSRNTHNDGNSGESNTSRGGNYAKKKVNWNLFCDHCKMHGYTRDICFKLIGYPDDWKFKNKSGHEEYGSTNPARGMNGNKGKNIANNVQIENSVEDLKHDAFGDKSVGFSGMQSSNNLHSVRTNLQALAMRQSYTPTQYQKIMQQLAEEDEEYAEVANMAGNPNSNDLIVFSISTGEDGYMDILRNDPQQQDSSEANSDVVPDDDYAEINPQLSPEVMHDVGPRTSTRSSHPPVWLKDCVTQSLLDE
ncbi:hypothetical protein H5410_047662 [Solanum commersonii]|uniref:Uncharacterized protein n=1 Tax=Solanum commersonii TaxID=4109 RepID=A0A9J5XIX5_SOLCO|nr:hypothetical protein H5410_047662 [Solanum commersonii]